MSALITRERATRNLSGVSPTAAENIAIDGLIGACSSAIEAFCRRSFHIQQYDELYNGVDDEKLLLKNYPIVSVERVAYDRVDVFFIKNTTSTNLRASAKVTKDGLELARQASGVTYIDASATWAANAKLSDLSTSVSALGNGWTPRVASGYENLAASDLRAMQGAMNCKGLEVGLYAFTQELSIYDIDSVRGILLRSNWVGSRNFYQVLYTAGYSTVPEEVQEACASWVAELFRLTSRDPAIGNTFASAAGTSYNTLKGIPDRIKPFLMPYRKIT